MTQKISVDFNVQDIHYEAEGEYSDEMAEKLKREVNTMLYSKDVYCFGYSMSVGLRELASASKGVINK